MTRLRFVLLLLLCFISATKTATQTDNRDQDEVTLLPGMQHPPNFKQYSGYLYAGPTKRMHYMFTESQSSPSTDPLLVWFNGGPGCSSMKGYLTGNGPVLLQRDGKTLKDNPYAWNKLANTLFLESPTGVGYSYDQSGNITVTDDMAAEQNYLAINDFLRKFPEFKYRALILAGVSYGGIYVPTLMVLMRNNPEINLKGGAIGNGALDFVGLDRSYFSYSYYHGLIGAHFSGGGCQSCVFRHDRCLPFRDWSDITAACCEDNQCLLSPASNQECKETLSRVLIELKSQPIDEYNIHGQCLAYGDADNNRVRERRQVANTLSFLLREILGIVDSDQNPKEIGDYPCHDYAYMDQYMNRRDVRDSLHIPSEMPEWKTCNEWIETGLVRQYANMKAQMQTLLKDKKYQFLIYNGDLDLECDFFGDEAFVDSLTLEEQKPRQPWYYTDEDGYQQIGGFTHQFEGLDFRTVRGGGHVVTDEQPRATFHMLQHFIGSLDVNRETPL